MNGFAGMRRFVGRLLRSASLFPHRLFALHGGEPMHDGRTVDLVHRMCTLHLAQIGYQQLYLIGSRARGTARPGSDHDFVAVVQDEVADDVLSSLMYQLQFEVARLADFERLGKVDLLVARRHRVDMPHPREIDLVPYACQRDGRVLWSRGE